MKKILRLILAAACLLLFSVTAAQAAEKVLTASCPASGQGQVIWQQNKAGRYLCLPGGWDASAISLSVAGLDCIYIGEEQQEIRLNEPADLQPYLGIRVPVRGGDGMGMGNLLIIQGSPVTSLMFQIDDKGFRAINGSQDRSITAGTVIAVESDGIESCNGQLRLMKTRGKNSFTYNKKSYEFKLEEKAPLGGMPKDRTWLLLANYADVSMLRNQITLDLCREIGLPYSVRCAPADVWVNGQYLGLYLLTEKIQIKKHRVNITNLEDAMKEVNSESLDSFKSSTIKDGPLPFMRGYEIPNDPEDITGGYLVTIEKPYRMGKFGYPGVGTIQNIYFRVKEPTNPSLAEIRYLAERIGGMHDAVFAEDGLDPATGKHYSEFLDVNSFALKFLVDDVSKNYDAAAGSQYMFKDSDKADPLFYAGPAWDYDISYGNAWRYTTAETDYYAMKPEAKYFYAQLGKHGDFRELLKEKWRDIVRPAMAVLIGEREAAPDGILKSFDEYVAAISQSAAMNEVRRNKGTPLTKDAGTDFKSGTEYLGPWLVRRTHYLDQTYAMTEGGDAAQAENAEGTESNRQEGEQ